MNMKIALLAGVGAVGALTVTSCGGSDHHSSATSSGPQMLDTSQVLTLARTSPDTSDPLAVNGGAVTVTPADDETSDSLAINGS